MSKINKFLLSLVIILILVLVGIIISKIPSSYYAVYLESGELYFGKLSYFPHLTLKSAYLLQINRNNKSYPYSLSKLENLFWGPQGSLRLNSSKIIWMAKLKNNSQIVKFIEGKAKPAPKAPVSNNQLNNQPSSISNPKNVKNNGGNRKP